MSTARVPAIRGSLVTIVNANSARTGVGTGWDSWFTHINHQMPRPAAFDIQAPDPRWPVLVHCNPGSCDEVPTGVPQCDVKAGRAAESARWILGLRGHVRERRTT